MVYSGSWYILAILFATFGYFYGWKADNPEKATEALSDDNILSDFFISHPEVEDEDIKCVHGNPMSSCFQCYIEFPE